MADEYFLGDTNGVCDINDDGDDDDDNDVSSWVDEIDGRCGGGRNKRRMTHSIRLSGSADW